MSAFHNFLDAVQPPFVLAERVSDRTGKSFDLVTYFPLEGGSLIVWDGAEDGALCNGTTDQALAEWSVDGIRVIDHRPKGGAHAASK